MVKKDKLLKKLLSGSKNVRFHEFTALIESFGFRLDRVTGSHHIYLHPDVPQGISVQPDSNNQAKPYQLRQFLKVIDKYELALNDDDAETNGDEVDESEKEDKA